MASMHRIVTAANCFAMLVGKLSRFFQRVGKLSKFAIGCIAALASEPKLGRGGFKLLCLSTGDLEGSFGLFD